MRWFSKPCFSVETHQVPCAIVTDRKRKYPLSKYTQLPITTHGYFAFNIGGYRLKLTEKRLPMTKRYSK